MKALLTTLFLSLAICLMAQGGGYGKRPGEIDSSEYRVPVATGYKFASVQQELKLNSLIFQNEYGTRWEAEGGTLHSIPYIKLYGDWQVDYIGDGKSIILVPKHYTIAPMTIQPFSPEPAELKAYSELTIDERKVTLNKLREFIEAMRGVYKVPSEADLEKLLATSPAFEYLGSKVAYFDKIVKYYRYTDEAMALLLQQLN